MTHLMGVNARLRLGWSEEGDIAEVGQVRGIERKKVRGGGGSG